MKYVTNRHPGDLTPLIPRPDNPDGDAYRELRAYKHKYEGEQTMKKAMILAQAGLVVLCGMGFSSAAFAARPDLPVFGAHLFGGGKFLNKDDWSPAEDQYAYGAQLDLQPHGWPIALTAGYFASRGSGDLGNGFGEFTGSTTEAQFGVKKFWQTGRIGRAFVEGGVTFVSGKGQVQDVSLKDNSAGPWIGGGYLFELGRYVDLGIEASYSYAKIDIGTDTTGKVSVDAGGLRIGALVGFRI